MKTNLVTSMAIVAIMLAGCNNDHEEIDNWKGEIRLSSGLSVQQTRANSAGVPDTQIAEGQQIGIYVRKALPADTYTGYSNVLATADGNGGFSSYSAEMFYPAGGGGVTIFAYHPYATTSSDEYDFTVENDQSTDANYYKSDLIYSASKEYARSKSAHSLTFTHQLSKVVCHLESGAGAPDIAGATVEIINPERSTKFNRATGALAAAVSSTRTENVKFHSTYGAVIPPQTFVKDTPFLIVKLPNATTFVYTIPNGSGDVDLVMAGSHVYTYNIKVNLTGLTVTSAITPWKKIADVSGNAEMEEP